MLGCSFTFRRRFVPKEREGGQHPLSGTVIARIHMAKLRHCCVQSPVAIGKAGWEGKLEGWEVSDVKIRGNRVALKEGQVRWYP